MNAKEEFLRDLRNLSLDREAVRLMQEDIARITEDEKQKELPALKREALEKEHLRLQASMVATVHHIERIERLLSFLSEREQRVLNETLVDPRSGAVPALAEEFNCELSTVYRLRALALRKLVRLRYGAGGELKG
jgi:DNA-directed RNA polymerase sigma subunit (sigma70/sigma32)